MRLDVRLITRWHHWAHTMWQAISGSLPQACRLCYKVTADSLSTVIIEISKPADYPHQLISCKEVIGPLINIQMFIHQNKVSGVALKWRRIIQARKVTLVWRSTRFHHSLENEPFSEYITGLENINNWQERSCKQGSSISLPQYQSMVNCKHTLTLWIKLLLDKNAPPREHTSLWVGKCVIT